MKTRIIYLFIACCIFLSCGKDELPNEEAWLKLQECRNNPIIDSSEIKENLIGTWELIGIGCGECLPGPYDISATIMIRESTGTISYNENGMDSTFNFTWDLELGDGPFGEDYYAIKSNPASFFLSMHTFCDNYMFYDYGWIDGYSYIYEKQ